MVIAVTANVDTVLEELNSDRKPHVLLNWCSHYCRKWNMGVYYCVGW